MNGWHRRGAERGAGTGDCPVFPRARWRAALYPRGRSGGSSPAAVRRAHKGECALHAGSHGWPGRVSRHLAVHGRPCRPVATRRSAMRPALSFSAQFGCVACRSPSPSPSQSSADRRHMSECVSARARLSTVMPAAGPHSPAMHGGFCQARWSAGSPVQAAHVAPVPASAPVPVRLCPGMPVRARPASRAPLACESRRGGMADPAAGPASRHASACTGLRPCALALRLRVLGAISGRGRCARAHHWAAACARALPPRMARKG